jgi:hypothetical protein
MAADVLKNKRNKSFSNLIPSRFSRKACPILAAKVVGRLDLTAPCEVPFLAAVEVRRPPWLAPLFFCPNGLTHESEGPPDILRQSFERVLARPSLQDAALQ